MTSSGLKRGIKLKGKELTEKFNELNKVSKITCTEKELNEYVTYGLLIPVKDKYMTRTGNTITVDIIKSKSFRFNIDLSGLIVQCENIAHKEKIQRIYCMTQKTFDKYKEQQLIVEKHNILYYRLYENELWRVYIL